MQNRTINMGAIYAHFCFWCLKYRLVVINMRFCFVLLEVHYVKIVITTVYINFFGLQYCHDL